MVRKLVDGFPGMWIMEYFIDGSRYCTSSNDMEKPVEIADGFMSTSSLSILITTFDIEGKHQP